MTLKNDLTIIYNYESGVIMIKTTIGEIHAENTDAMTLTNMALAIINAYSEYCTEKVIEPSDEDVEWELHFTSSPVEYIFNYSGVNMVVTEYVVEFNPFYALKVYDSKDTTKIVYDDEKGIFDSGDWTQKIKMLYLSINSFDFPDDTDNKEFIKPTYVFYVNENEDLNSLQFSDLMVHMAKVIANNNKWVDFKREQLDNNDDLKITYTYRVGNFEIVITKTVIGYEEKYYVTII